MLQRTVQRAGQYQHAVRRATRVGNRRWTAGRVDPSSPLQRETAGQRDSVNFAIGGRSSVCGLRSSRMKINQTVSSSVLDQRLRGSSLDVDQTPRAASTAAARRPARSGTGRGQQALGQSQHHGKCGTE